MFKITPLPPSNYVIIFYQNLEKDTWQLRQKKTNVFKKLANFIANFIKIPKFELLNC